jgi:hypothetical protein
MSPAYEVAVNLICVVELAVVYEGETTVFSRHRLRPGGDINDRQAAARQPNRRPGRVVDEETLTVRAAMGQGSRQPPQRMLVNCAF